VENGFVIEKKASRKKLCGGKLKFKKKKGEGYIGK